MNDDLLKELLNEANNIETQKIICVQDFRMTNHIFPQSPKHSFFLPAWFG